MWDVKTNEDDEGCGWMLHKEREREREKMISSNYIKSTFNKIHFNKESY